MRTAGYAEGLIDKQEFEPRITRLRQRLTALEEQAQQLQDEAALHTELRLIIGRLEDFAAQVRDGLAAADWTSKRELIRALVKRVEVTQDQVNVVFRVDQHPANPDPGKKSLQLRRGSAFPSPWDTGAMSLTGYPHKALHRRTGESPRASMTPRAKAP
jgi:site-specific DNA recombinase